MAHSDVFKRSKQTPVIDSGSNTYLMGAIAFNNRDSFESCPFESGNKDGASRINWMAGWLNQKFKVKHRELWKKYGVEY